MSGRVEATVRGAARQRPRCERRAGAGTRAIRALLALSLLCALLVPQIAVAEPAVTFADPVLETAVRTQLAIPSDPITPTDMLALTTLTVPQNAGLTSLGGLEHATNLEELYILWNDVTSLTPIAGCTKLRVLNFYYNGVTDLAPVAGLTELTSLSFGQNVGATDLTPLAGLTKIQTLDAGYIPVASLAPLAGMTEMLSLNLYSTNTIEDITPLAGMTKLQWLNISLANVTDITALKNVNHPSGGTLIMARNWIDFSPGSPGAAVVSTLTSRGYSILSDPQWAGGAVNGAVRDTKGRAIAGAKLKFDAAGPQLLSGAGGSYLLALARPGTRSITVSKPYFYSKTTTCSVSAGATTTANVTLSPVQLAVSVSRLPAGYQHTYRRRSGVAKFTLSATFRDSRELLGNKTVYLQKRKPGGSWRTVYTLTTNSSGKASKTIRTRTRGTAYYRWVAKANSWNKAVATPSKKIIVK